MPLRYVLCAAPLYLSRHGTPTTPQELSVHHCIAGTEPPNVSWQFTGPDGQSEVPIFGRLQVNNAMLRCDAARAGAGILLCADYLVEQDLASGRLLRLLPNHTPAHSTLHAVSPAYRASSPKVRSLVNHLSTQLGDPE
jgi:DNA-binding transcriptional LysR family regulator